MSKRSELRRIHKENIQLEAENNRLKDYYQSLEKEVEKTRMLHHDIRKHIEVLHTLMLSIEQESDTYHVIQDLTDKMNDIIPVTYVKHTVLNAVITNKMQVCINNKIKFQPEIHNFSTVAMKDCDVVVLFSNLLDNAIEECLRLPKDAQKRIELKSGVHANNTILLCRNTTNKSKSHFQNTHIKTEKNDDFAHGLGLQILEELLESYDATLSITIEEGMFQSSILFPNKEGVSC